jgi:steroid delta-isomerase-like uncharacterized protein
MSDSEQAANKALARRWFDEGWAQGRLEVAPEIFAPDFVLRGNRVGPAGPQRSVTAIRSAFTSLQVVVERQIAEGSLVVSHYRAEGRHAGEYRGLPATGQWISAHGVQIWSLRDGLVVEDWNTFDEWGLVGQIAEIELHKRR